MRVAQLQFKFGDTPDLLKLAELQALSPQLLLVFASPAFFAAPEAAGLLASAFPEAVRVGCSTAGEITRAGIDDDSCVLTAVRFDGTTVREAVTALADMADSEAAGVRLGTALQGENLAAVLMFGQGVAINGSALAAGVVGVLGAQVPVTGGLAGDGTAFQRTWVLSSSGPANDQVVAIGLYGERLRVGHGSFGGWEPFGPSRKVTRCDHNLLYELDGQPALEVYRRYLGDYADTLPASALLFPLQIIYANGETGPIRTILGIDEAAGSLILAGDVPADGSMKLMHSNADALAEGAGIAAGSARDMLQVNQAQLGLLVSCVGRKLVMGDLTDDEIEAVADTFNADAVLAGFYSYGELCPALAGVPCQLHNQTMTVTFLREE